jgi:hypothetical protein
MGFSVAQTLEIVMKKKGLIIGAVAATVVLAGGWAFAHGPGGFGPSFMQGHGGPGPGMMHHKGGMGPGMGPGMGRGMMQHQGGARGRGMMHGGAGPAQFAPERLGALKTELGITAAQDAAWTKYAKSVQDAASTIGKTRSDVDPNAVRNMTPADRFAFVTKLREQAQTQFTAVQTAANELLGVLDEAQKAKARTVLPGLAFGPPVAMRGPGAGGWHRH